LGCFTSLIFDYNYMPPSLVFKFPEKGKED